MEKSNQENSKLQEKDIEFQKKQLEEQAKETQQQTEQVKKRKKRYVKKQDDFDEHIGCFSYPCCEESPLGCSVFTGGNAEQYGHRD